MTLFFRKVTSILFQLSSLAALLVSISSAVIVQDLGAQDLGMAYFAISSKSFPCASALSPYSTPNTSHNISALAMLWGTFGTEDGKPDSCLARWFEIVKARKHALEIHLSNEPCRRNKRCEPSDFLANISAKQYNSLLIQQDPATIEAVAERVKIIRTTVERLKNSNTELIISTGLEDNFSLGAYRAIFEIVRANWPYQIVRNPVETAPDQSIGEANYIELHGDKPLFKANNNCIANLDGVDMAFPHRRAILPQFASWSEIKTYITTYQSKCRITFFWAAPWQGILSAQFVPPSKRSFAVSGEDLTAIESLTQ